jgi:hypothetical protein
MRVFPSRKPFGCATEWFDIMLGINCAAAGVTIPAKGYTKRLAALPVELATGTSTHTTEAVPICSSTLCVHFLAMAAHYMGCDVPLCIGFVVQRYKSC